ncbi:uncharacterized protein LOC128960027 [Oppia nitens]|uniref:uncharacterized protein LOC128960027 n=1 Tax=Oppia nitens TaxID=1686743 RepID=UPI0023DA4D3C|nr:uncharacterized protein LOC128960027 [Oppia nitens]
MHHTFIIIICISVLSMAYLVNGKQGAVYGVKGGGQGGHHREVQPLPGFSLGYRLGNKFAEKMRQAKLANKQIVGNVSDVDNDNNNNDKITTNMDNNIMLISSPIKPVNGGIQ